MHIPLFFKDIWIAWKKRPDVFICKKRLLNSPVLLPDNATLKISLNGWVPEQGHATRNPVHFSKFSKHSYTFQSMLSMLRGSAANI